MNRYRMNIYLLLTGIFFLHFIAFSTNPVKGFPAIGFIENKGQIIDQEGRPNPDVLYLYQGRGFKVQLRKSGYSYEILSSGDQPKHHPSKRTISMAELSKATLTSHRIDLDLLGMDANYTIAADEKNEGYLNYVWEGKETGHVPSFNKITYKNIYPNTDIEFIITGKEEAPFKYDIILHPGADLSKIKFLCGGSDSIKRTENGIIFSTPGGRMNENIPFSYYTDAPAKNEAVNYTIDRNIISFSANNIDKQKTFVIDPSTNRLWGTFYGGSGIEYCTSIATDRSSAVYIGGYTTSSSNIASAGVYQATFNGNFDAYLAKFDLNGVFKWGTYFGSSGIDIFYALHVDPSGNIYASGDTNSPSGIATTGAHQTVYGGGIDDAIFVKFDSNGQRLWSTYYGGTMHDISVTITMDSNRNVLFAGHTESTASIATSGAYNTFFSGAFDVFITKFDSLGNRVWGTYYGDTGTEEAFTIDTDGSNNIFISGFTSSLFGISTGGAYQAISGGNNDAFIAKFDAAGANLLYGSFYGGTGDEQGTCIRIAAGGDIFLSGNTTSPNNISGPGAYQATPGSSDDGFLARFTPSGSRSWGTYFGGNDVDYISDFKFDASMNLVFAGSTESTNNISTPGAYQPALSVAMNYDGYFAKFSPTGQPKLGTYYGGSNTDYIHGLVIDNTGKVFVAGETQSSNVLSSPGSYMPTAAGSGDGFLARFCMGPEPTVSPLTQTVCIGNTFSISTQSGFTYQWNTGATTNPLTITAANPPGIYNYLVRATDAFGCDGFSDTAKVMFSVCTSVSEHESFSVAAVYPVPAGDKLHIDLEELTVSTHPTIEVLSITGQILNSYQTEDRQIEIPLSSYAPGLYLIRIRSGHQFLERKFIKQ